MKTEAIYYEDGRVVLKNPVRLKTYPVRVELIIPDEDTEPLPVQPSGEILLEEDVDLESTSLREMLLEIHAVLGPLYGITDDGKTDGEKFAAELETSYR
jgi:hypothetical protein